MASQIVTKFIADLAVSTAKVAADAITGAKIRLANNQALRGRNAADSGDISVVKVNASDKAELGVELDAGAFKISNLGAPSASSDAATKGYVDTALNNWDVKNSVLVATTANITLSGAQTIDGVSVVAGNRVLVKNQSTAADNGIYVAAAGAWSRATDADAASELSAGFLVPVEQGTAAADTLWIMSAADVATVGTDTISFSKVGPVAAQTETFIKSYFTLVSGDITNQYIDLAHSISGGGSGNSLVLWVEGGPMEAEGFGYTVSLTGGAGGVTRVTFANHLATAGASALVAGDVIHVQYSYLV